VGSGLERGGIASPRLHYLSVQVKDLRCPGLSAAILTLPALFVKHVIRAPHRCAASEVELVLKTLLLFAKLLLKLVDLSGLLVVLVLQVVYLEIQVFYYWTHFLILHLDDFELFLEVVDFFLSGLSPVFQTSEFCFI
jgi:hypothetical protein